MSASDIEVARVAARQKRVISWEQLMAAGMSRRAVTRRIEQGTLQRLWRGVYLVGPGKPDRDSLAQAAILTCGGCSLGYDWAGGRWGFIEKPRLPVDVIVV